MDTQAQWGMIKGRIKSQGSLKGVIAKTVEEVERQTKEITITENGTIEVVPDSLGLLEKVTVTTDVIGGDVPEYQGSYEVTPSSKEQTLSTAKKVMREDVKIKEIPYVEVSNASGGITVTIG